MERLLTSVIRRSAGGVVAQEYWAPAVVLMVFVTLQAVPHAKPMEVITRETERLATIQILIVLALAAILMAVAPTV